MKRSDQTILVRSVKNPKITRQMTANSARLNKSLWEALRVEPQSPKIEGVIKICICTAVWRRPEVFELFAQGVKALQSDQVEITVIVSGSEGDTSRKLVESEGFVYIEIPNEPLSRKHNEAIIKAKQYTPHYIMLTGSDDILSPGAFDIYIEQMRKGIDFIGVTDFYFWDMVARKAAYWGGYLDKHRNGHTCGAFRCFSARLMNAWNWQPFEVKHSHVLDNSTQAKLRQIKHTEFIFSLKKYGVFGVDIKSKTNMTPFKLWENTSYISNSILKNKFVNLDKKRQWEIS